MNTHLPYKIHHLHLNEPFSLPRLDLENEGNYLVFWWHDYALGDLYLEPGTRFFENDYLDQLTTAIQPAISHYTQKLPEEKTEWKQYIKDREFIRWQGWMQQIFPQENSINNPVKVDVSVVICTRNRAPQLQRCLEMLSQQTCQPQEIIVVDNAPLDDSSEKVVKNFLDVQYVREPRPGLDIARNTGIKNATASIVAFTDDDVSVCPNWLYRLWQTFQDPGIAAMTGLVIAAELETEAQYIFEKHWSFNRGYTDIIYDQKFFQNTLKKGPPVWKIGAGANMAFRRSVFTEVGLFDELLDVGAAGCSGDSEMWYRILKNGHSILYNPRAIVFHEHRKEIENLKKQLFYYMRGFTVAALLQQLQEKSAGYTKQLFWDLPNHYASLLRTGFPKYPYRYRTLLAEMTGIISGLAYYIRNRKNAKLIR
jgi:glycosyltransferase involved in cell wall biosynthesis